MTEPFSDWTLSGDFPAGRPAWEAAGARFVEDIEPFEQRKLLLLNGGHLQLAFHGLTRGLATIADAVADPVCRRALEQFWDEAVRTVGPEVDAVPYCAALLDRFRNPRIAHRLDQIAVDTVTKLRLRVLPVVRRELTAGRDAGGALSVIRAWRQVLEQGVLADGPATAAPEEALTSLVSGVSGEHAAVIRGAASRMPSTSTA
ncbi:hypothetical protein [Microbacterium invictum]|uniref:Mannitol-1-phosphate/altronate dehydrogenase n=1 Tax=Microbacterium invictum TaxID=515415 RepID=A0AA40VMV2_9MICO|nr:hypothetical protein [Microbacterium invictum]MBB4140222.1 mannitol-1-phosphate/altronate dehydrogenase [Microbacterium invictum]